MNQQYIKNIIEWVKFVKLWVHYVNVWVQRQPKTLIFDARLDAISSRI